ncbi:MAG: 2-dehydro-3-deoxygalactonokinase [Balneolaceae bacterium]|nr:2-dehydro-3-deoxygalactonokinase [Balneolaceae bacterium]
METTLEYQDFLLSCDWGTSSFRLSVIDCSTSQLSRKITTGGGVKTLFTEWSGSDTPVSRQAFFLDYLLNRIHELEELLDFDATGIPVVISGMASSSIGITELPYADIPFSLDEPILPTKLILATEQFPHDILLVSGIKTVDDVMRGEEVQLLGLNPDRFSDRLMCVIPGTHSKHVHIEDRMIRDFDTFMTGEVFDLLGTWSVLSDSVKSPDTPIHTDAFREGVELAQHEAFLHALFHIRTNELLLKIDKTYNYDILSGLVIGTEIASLQEIGEADICLVSGGPLSKRYEIAMRSLGLHPTLITRTDELVMKGHIKIVNHRNLM